MQRRQLRADCRHLAAIQRLGGDQHAPGADADPSRQRLRTERREQRRHDAFRLQGAEHCDVQFGDAAGQNEDALAFRDSQLTHGIREAIGLRAQVAIGKDAPRPGAAEPAQCGAVAMRAVGVAIHRLVRNVQALPARQSIQPGARRRPGETSAGCVVIGQVGRHTQCGARFDDAGVELGQQRPCGRRGGHHAFLR